MQRRHLPCDDWGRVFETERTCMEERMRASMAGLRSKQKAEREAQRDAGGVEWAWVGARSHRTSHRSLAFLCPVGSPCRVFSWVAYAPVRISRWRPCVLSRGWIVGCKDASREEKRKVKRNVVSQKPREENVSWRKEWQQCWRQKSQQGSYWWPWWATVHGWWLYKPI